MKKTLRTILSLLLMGLLLSGCWQAEMPAEDTSLLPPDESGEEEETISKTLPQDFSLPYAPAQTLDPITCPDGMQQTVASLICEGLFRLDGNFRTENVLCAGYTYDPASRTYVFTLREDALFSDGSRLTASDVKAALDRARQSARYQARLAHVASVSVRDGAVAVRLSAPDASFPALLDIPVVLEQEEGPPLGSGYYRYESSNGRWYLQANPFHPAAAALPYTAIPLTEVSAAAERIAAFDSGDITAVTTDFSSPYALGYSGSYEAWDYPTTSLLYVGFRSAGGPCRSPLVRRAFARAFDREGLAAVQLSGHGDPTELPISPLCGDWDGDAAALRPAPPMPEGFTRLNRALQAQVLGTMLAPISGLACVLKQIAEKQGAPAEAPAEEAAAE